MKAPISVMVVGDASSIDNILVDKRVSDYVSRAHVRRPQDNVLVMRWDSLFDDPKRIAKSMQPLFGKVVFGTASLLKDLPTTATIGEIEDLEDVCSDNTAAESLKEILYFQNE